MKIDAISGNNFTGRSEHLVHKSGAFKNPILLNSDVTSFFTGLASDVRTELMLHSGDLDKLNTHLDKLELINTLNKNPYILSGGQQISLAIICAILSKPDFLGLDSTLEQIDSKKKEYLLNLIAQSEIVEHFLIDNRSFELSDFSEVKQITYEKSHKQKFDQFDRLNINSLQPIEFIPCTDQQAIKIKELSFQYNKSEPFLLRNLSIELTPDVYILDGLNGAGKSTLAKILSGVLKPNSGEFYLNSENIKPYSFPGRYVRYTFQNPDLQLFQTTIKQELESSLKHLELPLEEKFARVNNYANYYGLTEILDTHPLDAPFTLRKRIAIASTLIAEAPWVILDEPTINQDDQTVLILIQHIRQIVASGRGVIVISHSYWFKQLLKANTLCLENGHLTLNRINV
jgi:energy-coupling factor transport system ATP-binding protein